MCNGGSLSSCIFVAGNSTIVGDVTFGNDVSVWFGAVIRGDRERIVIGDGSNVQDNAVIHGSTGHPTLIGSQVSVGHGAILHGCTISDEVLIGMGAIVMNGAVIGAGSIIGAGAVVTEGKVIPPHSLVLGVPGKILAETTEEQRASILKNATDYIELAGRHRDA
ncbi:carbonic anhydrase/acetyltransferase-like protein (isoleucine patch superfamily) [Methanocalculus alkaliphilus]|uniref:gamma carbonic anhydrase family protein n=1 Tax=Methanocalculus alkaliphilus TaxID=768730 RepID=UPI0020A191B0|nr:gamma carbonic anhydrase family protein [Methanocalculus alkaliphilus]MCP1715356.1 carbonic anhydrase/acetyltransferase-like protein (isoleucine patch superfamily) [Methanocalculus alkaliphilus]